VLKRYFAVCAALGMAAAFVAAGPAAGAVTGYSVAEISAAGVVSTGGAGINESGQVAGTLRTSSGSSGFVWNRSTGQLRTLTTLKGHNTAASGINDNGDVAGSTGIPAPYQPPYPVVWDAAGGFRQLSGLGTASGVNQAGEVSGTSGFGSYRAVSWTSAGVLQQLNGDREGSAAAINTAGQVAGRAKFPGGYAWRAFLWDPRTGIRDLGALLPDPNAMSDAFGVNDLGHVVGGAEASSPETLYTTRAFLWRDGRMRAIGPDVSYAYAVNNRDDAVGQYLTGSFVYRAFVYSGGTFRDLNTLIPAGSGVVLETAVAINESGLIVANGRNRAGQQRAFVLTPR
jgi:probable HAF family extracellular repeat protein